jgi:hypothetical protein
VIGVAAGGFLATGRTLGNEAEPAGPAPTMASAGPTTPRTPRTSTAFPPTVTSCLQAAAASGEPAPGSTAKQRGLLDGSLIVVADSNYWMACDNTFRLSARKPAELRKPALDDNDAFAVANNTVTTADGERDYFWAAGLLPESVATVRYRFVDGAVVDAKVSNGFWMMRHTSTVPVAVRDLGSRVRVQLLSSTGAVLKDVRLNWGTQTCAQITHGC